jgi:3-hydroxy-9,10-secoandrosta-1,3,5(10)-triene-9,17-dione monooxygenase
VSALGHEAAAQPLEHAQVARHVTRAVSTLLDAHGSGGFAESSPLHGMWQDVNLGVRKAYGKALLGVENTVSPAV